jgi:hypothetical protein
MWRISLDSRELSTSQIALIEGITKCVHAFERAAFDLVEIELTVRPKQGNSKINVNKWQADIYPGVSIVVKDAPEGAETYDG